MGVTSLHELVLLGLELSSGKSQRREAEGCIMSRPNDGGGHMARNMGSLYELTVLSATPAARQQEKGTAVLQPKGTEFFQ